MPPISARMLMCPNAFGQRLLSTGSSTINSVAQTLRIISGRKRIASVELKPMLTGTSNLRIEAGLIGLRVTGWSCAVGEDHSLTVVALIGAGPRVRPVSKRFVGGAESRGRRSRRRLIELHLTELRLIGM